MFETVNYTVENQIATIAMNVPKTLNAIHLDMHRDLYAAFTAANEDETVRCVILTGEGRGFSSGADLSDIDFADRVDYGDYLQASYNKLLRYMAGMRKPVIAAIHGVAAGAGLSLALACDFRLATSEARLTIAFIKIGLIPDAGAHFYLPRIVGLAKALELSMLGSVLNGTEAERIGLVNRTLPEAVFHDEVRALAQQLARMPTLVLGKMKELMYKSMESDLETVLGWEEEGQRLMGKSADHEEGVRAFLEKRLPDFRGR